MNPYDDEYEFEPTPRLQLVKGAAIGSGSVISGALLGAVIGYLNPKAGVIMVLAGVIPPQVLSRSGQLNGKAWAPYVLDGATAIGAGAFAGSMISAFFSQTGQEKPSLIEVAKTLGGTIKGMWPFNLLPQKSGSTPSEEPEQAEGTGRVIQNPHDEELNKLILGMSQGQF